LRVELAGRLVQGQDLRPQGQGSGDCHPLPLTPRKRIERTVAQVGQLQQAQHFFHPLPHLACGHRPVFQPKGNLCFHVIQHCLRLRTLKN
jgi:hypothetical protein